MKETMKKNKNLEPELRPDKYQENQKDPAIWEFHRVLLNWTVAGGHRKEEEKGIILVKTASKEEYCTFFSLFV